MLDYNALGTSNKRKENSTDHKILADLMRSWDAIRDTCRQSPTTIKAWQLEQIKRIVHHAYTTVPLYHEKYAAAGIKPEDIRTWDDFKALPLLTKDELITAFPDKSISIQYTTEFTTRSSGTSGKFVTLAVSPEAIHIDTIQGARQLYFQTGGRHRPTDKALFIYTSPWWFSSINGEYPCEFLPTTMTPDEAERRIAQYQPKVISVYPTYLKGMCANGARLSDYGVELVITHSEQSSPGERRQLEELLGVEILDEFSSEELTRIALECPFHKYHLEEDACYIEIIDKHTRMPCEDHSGLVVGTNLLNRATPIIRYSQGDVAQLSPQVKCPCGSNFRVLSQPMGRVLDSIILPDSRFIPASCFMDVAYNWYLELGVPVHGLKYQIVQNSVDSIDLYLVPGAYGINDAQQKTIKESMYQLLPRTTRVGVHIVDATPYTGAKARPVLSLVNPK